MSKKWTNDEIEFLKEWYPNEGATACADVLDRTAASIKYKMQELKIRSNKSKLKTNEQYCSEIPGDYKVLEQYINTKTKITNIKNNNGNNIHTTYFTTYLI